MGTCKALLLHGRSPKAAAASEIKAAAYSVADVLSLFSAFRQQVNRRSCCHLKACDALMNHGSTGS